MKRLIMIFAVGSILLMSCEDEQDPFPFEKPLGLLAGEKGGSKSWVLEAVTFNGVNKPVTECESDDIYTFYNNDSQKFVITAGGQKCDAGEADVLEEGAWMFSRDGKTIIIASNYVHTTKLVSFFGLSRAANILELTETDFRMEINVVKDGEGAVIVISFNAS